MNKKLLLLAILLFSAFSVNAAMNPIPAFCEGQGYELTWGDNLGLEDDSRHYCVFDDGNYCLGYDFFQGKCGQEYVREFPCKPLGEVVFSQFEECCEGKPYLHFFYMGQQACQPWNVRLIGSMIHNPLFWLVELILLIVIIYFIIKKIRKNRI